jgi:hypothetical protein
MNTLTTALRSFVHASLLTLALCSCGAGDQSADPSQAPVVGGGGGSTTPPTGGGGGGTTTPPTGGGGTTPPPGGGGGGVSEPLPSVPPLANLPAWVSGLAVGEWFAIPNTSMQSVEPSPVPPGNGPGSKVVAWTSFVMDTRTSKVYSVANGGHNDYAGNEVDVLALEATPPAWTQVLAPTPNAQITNCQSYYGDGRPTSRHSYYGVTLDRANDRIMLFGGAHWCGAGGFHTATSSYNIAANSYNPSSAHPNVPIGITVATVAADTITGDVYLLWNFSLLRWSRTSNGWTTLRNGNSPAIGFGAASAMDSTRGRFLFAGNSASNQAHYTPATDTFTTISLAGPNAADVINTGQGLAMIYVPAIDRFIVRKSNAGGTVYQIHPTTFQVTEVLTTGGDLVPGTQNGPYNKFLYVPRLGGAIYVPSYTGNAWFLRLH